MEVDAISEVYVVGSTFVGLIKFLTGFMLDQKEEYKLTLIVTDVFNLISNICFSFPLVFSFFKGPTLA